MRQFYQEVKEKFNQNKKLFYFARSFYCCFFYGRKNKTNLIYIIGLCNKYFYKFCLILFKNIKLDKVQVEVRFMHFFCGVNNNVFQLN